MADVVVKKVTKRERYAELKELVKDNADLVAFIDHEVELLDKKNSADKKPTKTQVENLAIKTDLVKAMKDKGFMSATDICKAYGHDITNQKVSALLRQLIGEGSVERTEVKGKAMFQAKA